MSSSVAESVNGGKTRDRFKLIPQQKRCASGDHAEEEKFFHTPW
jgi:hypothetical protein